jgi:hypothetical protein
MTFSPVNASRSRTNSKFSFEKETLMNSPFFAVQLAGEKIIIALFAGECPLSKFFIHPHLSPPPSEGGDKTEGF